MEKSDNKVLNIVLFEPEIPQNTGNVARTCAATGARLHLVRPFGFEITDRNLKRAGLDYWYLVDITYYDSIDDFFEKTAGGEYFFFSTKARRKIPMIDEARSLNLANSVAIGCYEVLRQWDYPTLLTKGELHRHHWDDIE